MRLTIACQQVYEQTINSMSTARKSRYIQVKGFLATIIMRAGVAFLLAAFASTLVEGLILPWMRESKSDIFKLRDTC